MFRTVTLAALLSVTLAAPALARRCPMEMAAIDKALPTAQISATDRDKVMDLRKRGEAAHAAGRHAESEKLLDEAKAILKIK